MAVKMDKILGEVREKDELTAEEASSAQIVAHNQDTNAHKTLFEAKADANHTHTAESVGADETGAADNAVAEHEADTNAHKTLLDGKAEANHTHTAGTDLFGQLPPPQQAKIRCGEAHFAALGKDTVTFHAPIASYDRFDDLVNRTIKNEK